MNRMGMNDGHSGDCTPIQYGQGQQGHDLSHKKLLVLGASQYQLPIIQQALQLGIHTIVVDNRPQNPGHAIASKSYLVSTTDRDQVLRLARKEQIDGVIAAATDVAVPTAAFLGQELNLIAPPIQASEITCSKLRFREFCRDHDFKLPQFFELREPFCRLEELFNNSCHWIIKPDQSSGSKGIRVISDFKQLPEALASSTPFSLNSKVLLEEFIIGHQGTVEGFLVDGELGFSIILDRKTAPLPYVATTGHQVPSKLSDRLQGTVLEEVTSALTALHYTNGAFDCDFVVTESGETYLLEIALRLGGNSISQLIRASTDTNLALASIFHVLGLKPQLPGYMTKPTRIRILGLDKDGELSYRADKMNDIRALPGVLSLVMDYPPGAKVRKFTNGQERVGEMLIQGISELELERAEVKALELLELKVTEQKVGS